MCVFSVDWNLRAVEANANRAYMGSSGVAKIPVTSSM